MNQTPPKTLFDQVKEYAGLAALILTLCATLWGFGVTWQKQSSQIDDLQKRVATLEARKPEPVKRDAAREQCADLSKKQAELTLAGKNYDADRIGDAMNNLGCHRIY